MSQISENALLMTCQFNLWQTFKAIWYFRTKTIFIVFCIGAIMIVLPDVIIMDSIAILP